MTPSTTIGILALQGAFAEHQSILRKLKCGKHKVDPILVRTVEDLKRCDALIIPGGESTTMALLAKVGGLLEPLREFVKIKPVWGTCAGAILLASQVENMKKGGQDLLNGMSLKVCRNGWGSQVESFEAPLQVNGLQDSDRPFTGVFIRAPVILSASSSGGEPPIKIIARLSPNLLPHDPNDPSTTTQLTNGTEDQKENLDDPRTWVALRQGSHLLTTFHPELTRDDRFHDYFIRNCVLPALDPKPN